MILPLLLIPILTLLFLTVKKIKKPAKLPSGPRRLPIIGNLHQLGGLPHRSLQKLAKTYGDLMFLQLGFAPTLIVSSADRARDLFKNHDLAISGRPALYVATKICYNLSCVSTAPYGDYWREARRILVLELMTAKRVESFRRVRVEEVGRLADRVISASGPLDLSAAVFDMSRYIVSRAAFGAVEDDGGGGGRSFREIFHEAQRLAAEFNAADYFPGLGWINRINGVDSRIAAHNREMERFLNKVIGEHRRRAVADSDKEDIVDVLLRVQKESALTDDQLKAVLLDVFLAGTDTSAATIIWTMAELMRNPTVRQKAQREIREIIAKKGNNTQVEESDLPNLKYLKQIIKESFRLHPPAPLLVPRETTEACAIDGGRYEIPAKTRVFFNAAAIAADPAAWENPAEFSPERFEGSHVDFRGQHFELLPFGAGRRGCPGMSFAIPVVELAVANLLFRFDWKLPEGMSAADVDMEEALGITMHKKTPLCLLACSVSTE